MEVYARQILENMPMACIYCRLELNDEGEAEDFFILDMNQAFEKTTGLDRGETAGKRATEVFPGVEHDSFDWFYFYERVAMFGEKRDTVIYCNLTERWYRITAFSPQKQYFISMFLDVTEEYRTLFLLEKKSEEITALNIHDALTGLYNRRFIESEIKRLDADPEQLPVSVIIGDVNGLKITNDVFGQEAGNQILKNVADVLKGACRDGDIAARWGGDEFLVLLPGTAIETAREIIYKIGRKLPESGEGATRVSVSLGCAVKDRKEQRLFDIMKHAEQSMFQNKFLEKNSYRNSLINTLLAMLYEKSTETREHSDRLREYCHAVGRCLNLTDFDMNNLSLLALLHDIGKVAIDPNILKKPGALTTEEWVEMKKHPEIGYRIMMNSPELSSVSDYILSHHEHWDGSGYPKGIKGEEIPLLCRILAVADAYDAMTCDRSYRGALSHEEAVAELLRNAGKQFDEDIVALFSSTINQYK